MVVIGQAASDPSNVVIPAVLTNSGVSGVLFWLMLRSDKRAERAEDRERIVRAEQMTLLERLIPPLIAATEALEHVQVGMQRTVDYVAAENPPSPNELRSALSTVTAKLESLERRLPAPRKRET